MSPRLRFHKLKVRDVKRETDDAVSIALTIPADLAQDYVFTPGQYLTVRRYFDGVEVRRSYSICSSPTDGELRIAVKRLDGGAFSTFATSGLRIGEELEVMPPAGRFGIEPDPASARLHVGFAAGSGITPIMSILRAVLLSEPQSRFFLFYGNRTAADIVFREALDDLKDRFLSRLSLFHVLSGEHQETSVLNGRLDGAKARALLTSLVPARSVDHVFICGPIGMADDVEAVCSELGLQTSQIHRERFLSSFEGKQRERQSIDPSASVKCTASLIVDGKRADVGVHDGETVLDAALRHGLDLPYACKGGMCSTCRAKVVQGAVSMDINYSLERWEIEAGYVLTCQSHPTTDRVTIDYDAV